MGAGPGWTRAWGHRVDGSYVRVHGWPLVRIALIGTRGAPARYGGFETAVEEIGARLAAAGHEVVVYCRNPGQHLTFHRGMELVNLPALRAPGLETLSHSLLSALHQQRRPSAAAIVFNAANAPLLPLLRRRGIPVGLNVDGVEWQRSKWGPWAKRYYRAAERIGVRTADVLIADARGIQDYYRAEYGAEAVYIPYGARVLTPQVPDGLEGVGLQPGAYHLVVARFEPENNLAMIINGYLASAARHPLVLVGDAPRRHPVVQDALTAARGDPRVVLTGSIWDQALLDRLYGHAATYVHGHSVGGTNPSLLRAMGAAAPVIAFDVRFNREVLGPTGRFFSDPAALTALLQEAEASPAAFRRMGEAAQERVDRLYSWDQVATDYERLCLRLALTPPRRPR